MVKHQATKSPSDQLYASEWNAEHLITEGLDSAKPIIGLVAGQLYWATDTKILYKATGPTIWQEILRGETVTRLAQLSERSHASLVGVSADQHHAKNHASRHVDGGADQISNKLDYRAMNIIHAVNECTTSFSTTSTSMVDSGLRVDSNLPFSSNCFVYASALYVRNYSSNCACYEGIYRDGSEKRTRMFNGIDADFRLNSLIQYIEKNVPSGAHTWKMRVCVGCGTGYWYMTTGAKAGEMGLIASKY